MILDRLENAKLYRPLGATIAAALDYLGRTDFSKIPAGRHELDGDRVFVIVQRGPLKPLTEVLWEAHRQYIDVQYVVEGIERMGHALLRDGLTARQAYDPQKDFITYDTTGDFFDVRAGSFALFAPQDIHAPGLVSDLPEASEKVCKAVVKCRLA